MPSHRPTSHPESPMDTLPDAAEAVLRRHPAPALRLDELLPLVRLALRDPALDRDRLLQSLSARPERFRLLDPWRGPWKRMIDGPDPGPLPGPWVVVVGDPGGEAGPSTGGMAATRMRACVQWMAVGVDPTSAWSLARWHGLALAEASVRGVLKRAA